MSRLILAAIAFAHVLLATGKTCTGPSHEALSLGVLDLTLPAPQTTCLAPETLKCRTDCQTPVSRRLLEEEVPSTLPRRLLAEVVDRSSAMPKTMVGRWGRQGRRLSQSTDGLTYTPGSSVLTGDVRVHLVWYGSWPTPNPTQDVFETFISNVACSDWWAVLGQYYSASGSGNSTSLSFVDGSITLGTSATVAGDSIGDDACGLDGVLSVYNIVTAAISSGNVTDDGSAANVYLVIPSADVTLPDNFNTAWCGWHYFWSDPAKPLMYGLIGNPASAAGSSCRPSYAPDPLTSATPNGDYQADTMINILVHELAELVLDPHDDTWKDASGSEGADLCEWEFGTPVAGGSPSNPWYSNTVIADNHYLIQLLWSNDGSTCKFGNVTTVAS